VTKREEYSSITSKVMSARAVVSLLKRNRPLHLPLKMDINQYCFGVTKQNTSQSIPIEEPVKLTSDRNRDSEASKDFMIDDCASSVTVSWPIPDGTMHVPLSKVLDVERAMKECYHNVVTSRPFFVLDGEGRRMALLSLKCDHDKQDWYDEENGSLPRKGL